MPDEDTLQRAREDAREGKSPSTQAGEFVREEIEHVREGKHGARNTKQAIAIGLSKARRAGIRLRPPRAASPEVQERAARDSRKGRHLRKPSKTRSRAVSRALRRESRRSTSRQALAKQARGSARRRGAKSRRRSARRAARTRSDARRLRR
jgi:hypothetical protein